MSLEGCQSHEKNDYWIKLAEAAPHLPASAIARWCLDNDPIDDHVIYDESTKAEEKRLRREGDDIVSNEEQQRINYMQEQINEAMRALTKHEERFGWIAQRLKGMDERDETTASDVHAIKEKIFNGFGEAIANTNTAVNQLRTHVVRMTNLFQKHEQRPHLSAEDVMEFSKSVYLRQKEEEEEQEEEEQRWFKTHKLEVIAVVTPVLTAATIALMQIVLR
jgi:hypothetical protein